MQEIGHYTNSQIQRKAEDLLGKAGVKNSFPCPIEKIISFLGYTSFLFKPTKETETMSGVVDHSSKKIFINDQDSPKRRLFTAAHEVGHICLHPGDDHIDYRNSDFPLDQREKDADYFAACLLMPEKSFREKWEEFQSDIGILSVYFGASRQSVSMRADSLGL